MPQFSVRLIKKEEIANETLACYLTKPAHFTFTAGQSLDLTLINPPETDAEGNKRAFSIASAPYEEHLMIATRMRDTAFKRVLKEVPINTEFGVDGPFGRFTLENITNMPVVFLTGGIGVTPARSMVAQATKEKASLPLTLFYANKTAQDTAFMADFEHYAQENSNFTFVPIMTRAEAAEWEGERGYVTQEMLAKYLTDVHSPIYFISGPVAMVKALRQTLIEAQVSMDHIKTEIYSGY